MFKIVKNYYEAKPRLVYLICCSIRFNYLRNYAQRPSKCILYISLHKLKEYKCRISGYKVDLEKICTYVKIACTNC